MRSRGRVSMQSIDRRCARVVSRTTKRSPITHPQVRTESIREARHREPNIIAESDAPRPTRALRPPTATAPLSDDGVFIVKRARFFRARASARQRDEYARRYAAADNSNLSTRLPFIVRIRVSRITVDTGLDHFLSARNAPRPLHRFPDLLLIFFGYTPMVSVTPAFSFFSFRPFIREGQKGSRLCLHGAKYRGNRWNCRRFLQATPRLASRVSRR